MLRSLVHYSIVSLLFLGILVANVFAWQSSLLGGLLLLLFLLFFGKTLHKQLALGVASLVALVSILGAIAFYLFNLTPLACLIIIFLIILAIPFFHLPHFSFPSFGRISLRELPVLLCACVLFITALRVAIAAHIVTPVRSPWLVIPAAFFLLIFLFSSLTVASRSRLLFVALFFLTTSVALFAYPLGYGFDAFIHQATEQHVVEHGTITPKPLYYVGQYALVVTAANAFSIPVETSDLLLLPLLLILLAILCSSQAKGLSAFALFLIPLSSFIVTTPQGLANFWVLLVILTSCCDFAFSRRNTKGLLLLLFTIAALVTHPLSGIPAVFFLLIARSVRSDGSSYRTFWPLVGLGSIIMPLVFVLNSLMSGQSIAFHPEKIFPLPLFELLHLDFFLQNRFDAWKDLLYLFGWNQTLVVLVLTVAGYRLAKKSTQHHALRIFGLMSIILLVNYLLLDRLFEFSFLIEYERSNYAERLFTLAQFFALPLVALTLADWSKRLASKPIALKAGAVGLTAMMLTAVVYMNYPRHDNYEISRGFNVGTSDFSTAQYLHDKNAPGTYVVLANQAVSAAALKTYGFETYFHGDLFYYPIPTGGALYQIYLEMVNNAPTSATAKKAMDLAGVDTAYFVVNDYWFLADKIIENAKREAKDWVAIDNGATTVFEYRR